MRNDDGGRGMELLGLGLASGAVLGSQIAMTRILSLKYAANQTFLVVSFAAAAIAVAMMMGYSFAMMLAGVVYVGTAGVVWLLSRKTK